MIKCCLFNDKYNVSHFEMCPSASAHTVQQTSNSTCGISVFSHILCIFTDSLVRLTSQVLSCVSFNGIAGHISGMR